MNKLLIALALSLGSPAFAARNVKCTETTSAGTPATITFSLVSPTRLENVVYATRSDGKNFTSTTPVMEGKSDPWQMSPQPGERFYFHSGNTSSFLLFAEGVLANAIKNSAPYRFGGQDIFEQYEQGGSQDILELSCATF
jgi:hypothetical protein